MFVYEMQYIIDDKSILLKRGGENYNRKTISFDYNI